MEAFKTSRQLGMFGPLAGQEIGPLTGKQLEIFVAKSLGYLARSQRPKDEEKIARQYPPEGTPTFDEMGDTTQSNTDSPMDTESRCVECGRLGEYRCESCRDRASYAPRF